MREHSADILKLPYAPPSMEVIGTFETVTQASVCGNSTDSAYTGSPFGVIFSDDPGGGATVNCNVN